MTDTEAPAPDHREELIGLRRLNRLLVCLLVLTVALALTDRVGNRVYAVAVFDPGRGAFVEQAYLAQREQAEQVLAKLLRQARDQHPVYREHGDVFDRSNPRFAQPVVLRRVYRQVSPEAGEAPIAAAVKLLQPTARVVVDGYGLFTESSDAPVVVLASDAWALQARNTRLENVTARVEEQLTGIGLLTQEPEFVPPVTTKLVPGWPIERIKTVGQAVEILTRGERRDALHTVAAGEEHNLARIATGYGCTVADLVRWNSGRDLSLLKVGDTLVVRKPEPPVAVKTVEHRYPIQRGELNGRMRRLKLTIEVVRHDGDEVNRTEIRREPAD